MYNAEQFHILTDLFLWRYRKISKFYSLGICTLSNKIRFQYFMNDKMVVKKVLTCDVRERKILIDLQVPGFVCKRQIEEMFYFFLRRTMIPLTHAFEMFDVIRRTCWNKTMEKTYRWLIDILVPDEIFFIYLKNGYWNLSL